MTDDEVARLFEAKRAILVETSDDAADEVLGLGDDELCSGYERCFHKEIPFVYDGRKLCEGPSGFLVNDENARRLYLGEGFKM